MSDYSREVIATSYSGNAWLTRHGNNVQIDITVTTGVRYAGQDWGEGEFNTTESRLTLDDCSPIGQLVYWQLAKRLPEGKAVKIDQFYADDLYNRIEAMIEAQAGSAE